MIKPLSENMVGGLVGGAVLLAVLGAFAYFYLSLSKPEPVAVQESVYDLTVVSRDMKQSGVFDNTIYLDGVPQSQGATVRYTEEDLGKQNLTQPE